MASILPLSLSPPSSYSTKAVQVGVEVDVLLELVSNKESKGHKIDRVYVAMGNVTFK